MPSGRDDHALRRFGDAGLVRGDVLVIRRGVPVLAELPRPSLRSADLFTTIVAPFFAIYLARKLFKDDWLAYLQRALDYQLDQAFSGVDVHSLRCPRRRGLSSSPR